MAFHAPCVYVDCSETEEDDVDRSRERKRKAVLDAALDLPADEREAYVARECAADDKLMREVRAMLLGMQDRCQRVGLNGPYSGRNWALRPVEPERSLSRRDRTGAGKTRVNAVARPCS